MVQVEELEPGGAPVIDLNDPEQIKGNDYNYN